VPESMRADRGVSCADVQLSVRRERSRCGRSRSTCRRWGSYAACPSCRGAGGKTPRSGRKARSPSSLRGIDGTQLFGEYRMVRWAGSSVRRRSSAHVGPPFSKRERVLSCVQLL